jgi:hypothetical protein
MSFLSDDALQDAVEWNLRPGVGGGYASWPAGWPTPGELPT